MNNMPLIVKQFCLILALGLSAGSALAEDPKGKPPKPDLSELFTQLQLTDEQQSDFQQLLDKHHQQRRGAGKNLRQQHRSEMAEVLSEEQMGIFETFMKSHRPPKRRNGKREQ
jgi:hypothetical protein